MDELLTEKEWERFSDLLDKIVNSGGTWEEKAAAVRANCNETNLGEFANWFITE